MSGRSAAARAGIFCLIAAAFYCLSFPFQDLYFPEGTVVFRFSGFMPMLCGLLFGPLGAAACAAGNVLVDCTRQFVVTDLFGCAGVFLMGWLPYRMWHALLRRSDRPRFFSDAFSILKYALIALIASICAAAVPEAAAAIAGVSEYHDFFAEAALQYYDESLFAGMLLLQLFTFVFRLTPHIPWRAYEGRAPRRPAAYAAATAACAGALILRTVGFSSSPFGCWVIVLGTAYLALMPIRASGAGPKPRPWEAPRGLRAQFITGFLALFCAVLVYYELLTLGHMLESGETGPAYWRYLLRNMAGASTVMTAVLYFLLWLIDRNVIRPLKRVSDYARDFLDSGSPSKETLTVPKTRNEVESLGHSVAHMTGELTKYMEVMRAETAARERAAAEMDMARRIQFSMLPSAEAGTGNFSVSALMEPAREVGGDFYDFDALGPDRLFACIADVSGKGVSAALFMMRAKTIIQSADKSGSLSRMMRELNDLLAENNEAMMFVTVFAAILDRSAGVCSYVNAGHNPPLILENGAVRFLESPPDTAAGPLEGMDYTQRELTMGPDFGLLLYTDGVTEAQNAQGAFYGEERLLKTARRLAHLPAPELVRGLRQDVAAFCGAAPAADDITVLCARAGD